MRLGSILLAGFAAFAATSATSAAGASEKPKEGAPSETNERQMTAPNIVTPVVRGEKLVNYLFVSVVVDFTAQANAMKLRDRAHFLRDAFLKASHKHQLADPGDDTKLNASVAAAVFRAAAKDVLGVENVKSVSIVGVDSLKRR